MFKCFQNRSKQTVIKLTKSLKLKKTTLVSLKSRSQQIQKSKRNITEIASNEIPSIPEHSQLIKKCRISMNTEVKCSITEASSNELLGQIEVHNGLIPAYIVKKHDGPIPCIHHLFFPSNAVSLPPGRSTCFQACCILDLFINSRRGRSCNGRKIGRGPIHSPIPLSRHQRTRTEKQNKNTTQTKQPTQKAENHTTPKQ